MTASELLRRAKALVAREEDWWPGPTRGGLHFNQQLCVMQSINRLTGKFTEANWNNIRSGSYDVALDYLSAACGPSPKGETSAGNIVWFNDHHTYAEVMAMWERAIELAEAAEMGAELVDIALAEEPEAVLV